MGEAYVCMHAHMVFACVYMCAYRVGGSGASKEPRGARSYNDWIQTLWAEGYRTWRKGEEGTEGGTPQPSPLCLWGAALTPLCKDQEGGTGVTQEVRNAQGDCVSDRPEDPPLLTPPTAPSSLQASSSSCPSDCGTFVPRLMRSQSGTEDVNAVC